MVRATVAAIATLLTFELSAHHSFALFDLSKPQTVPGTVIELQWENPHTWVDVMVTGNDGAGSKWSFEGASPNALRRQGWSRDSLKAGDRVTVGFFPFRDGARGGALRQVTLENGKVLTAYTFEASPPEAK